MGKHIHTATYRGAWVRVELRDGRRFTAQFIERTGGKRIKFKGVSRLIHRGDITRFITNGVFSPNTGVRSTWDTVKPEEV